jgi:metal-responsive CopG/Arc/MetJ family transcriptional regulator
VKTAVSLPDDVFDLAEQAAKDLRISRSQLYAKAIAEFLKHRQTVSITGQLNEVYGGAGDDLDHGVKRAGLKLLRQAKW